MNDAQRKYDFDLATSMERMSKWIEPRSRKVSDTLRLGAKRLRELAYGEPTDVAPPPLKPKLEPSPRQRRSKKNR